MEVIRSMIPTDLKLIKDFRDSVLESFEEKYIDGEFLFKTRLILDELIANSYKHGNEYDCSKNIEAVVISDENFCMFKIKDEGKGIDYVNKSDCFSEHGRGIKLVYSLADKVLIKDNMILALIINNNCKDLVYNTWYLLKNIEYFFIVFVLINILHMI